MSQKTFKEVANFYLKRFAFQKPVLVSTPKENTKLIITIPCHNEPNLLKTLDSLYACDAPQNPVEVIIIINAGEPASEEVIIRNRNTLQESQRWIDTHISEKITFQVLENNQLPQKDAGVGLARKIVMDEALARFASINLDGAILCLDADCEVKKNYLQVIEKKIEDSELQSASIYFEHLPAKSSDLELGISNYELFLRYYVQGLKYAHYPFAFHTIGSSMVVRASTYALSGGMNRRKAGEDFYFLHKVAHLGKLVEITETTVFPSARISDRVPFGTGKAQEKWLENSEKVLKTYDPQIFEDLKVFLSLTNDFFQVSESFFVKVFEQIPQSIQSFLNNPASFWQIIQDMNQRTKQLDSFRKRYFAWLDGLKVLKIVHFLRDNFYPEIKIVEASYGLYLKKYGETAVANDLQYMLQKYRELDKEFSAFV